MHIVVINGKAYLSKEQNGEQVLQPVTDGAFDIKGKKQDLRTYQQNKSLWLYYSKVAKRLNDAGLEIKQVIKADVPWTKDTVHDVMWRPIQKALLGKESTTSLKKNEIDTVYEVMNRLLGEKFGIHVDFPSEYAMRMEIILKETA